MKTCLSMISLIVLFFGCKETTVSPDRPRNARELIWSADSLPQQTSMHALWGINANNLYGITGGTPELWHFNGNQWSPVQLHSSDGGPVNGLIEVYDVFGFRPDDIWAVGIHWGYDPVAGQSTMSSLLLHFNGASWQEINLNANALFCLGGQSQTNLFAAGLDGEVFHYDGTTWKKDSVAFSIPPDRTSFPRTITRSPRVAPYLSIFSHPNSGATDAYYLFQRDSSRWKLVDSSYGGLPYAENLWMSTTGSLYGAGSGVFKWSGNAWSSIKPESALIGYYLLTGSDDNNIFAVSSSGVLSHFDGVSWYTFPSFQVSPTNVAGVWTDGIETFVVSRDNIGTTFINHGK